MNLSNKRAEFLLIKSTKWNNARYIELTNNDIQSSSTSMRKKKLRKRLNRILKKIINQRYFNQLNDFKSFWIFFTYTEKINSERLRYKQMNALIHSTYLYSLGMSTKIQVLNYRSVTTIIDLIFFPSQLLDINVNKIHFFSTPAVFRLRMKITGFFLECLTVTNSFLHH